MAETTSQHIDASSMIALKAELYKKQEALKLAKLKNDSGIVKRKGLKLKGEELYKKPKNSSQPLPVPNVSEEEEEALKKSRLALERKATLYEKIMSKKVSVGDDDDDDDKLYMVDFRRKLMNSENQPTDDSKSSFESTNVVEQDRQVLPPIEKPRQRYEEFFFVPGSNTDTATSFTNILEENKSEEEGPIHYQNVQYNEVRDHGVGYYAFSTDEEKRKEQMELLQNLRQQTEKKKAAFQNTEQKRKSALQARLAKICERRNIDKSTIENFIPKNDDQPLEAINKPTDIDVSDIPLPDGDAVVLPPKPVKVRPWDEGKDAFGYQTPAPKNSRVTQKHWIEERRSERLDEFAPPSMYSANRKLA